MISVIKNNFVQYIKTIKVKKFLYKYFLEHFIWWKYENVPHNRNDPGLCVCVQRTKDINPFQCHLIWDFLCLTCADGAVGEDYPASTVLALLFAVWPKVHLQVTGRLQTGSMCGVKHVCNDLPSLVFFLNIACLCVFSIARKPLTLIMRPARKALWFYEWYMREQMFVACQTELLTEWPWPILT